MRNRNSTVSIVDCDFTDISAAGVGPDVGYGGGIYSQGCSLEILNCRFRDNKAHNGGGMNTQASCTKVTGCLFARNSAGSYGGGEMYNGLLTDSEVSNCVFEGNQGGGISNMHSSLSVVGCRFVCNRGRQGAGMRNYESTLSLSNCLFIANSATRNGGAMENHESSPRIVNCVFARNTAAAHGGAIYNLRDSDPRITNCTFFGNSSEGGAVIASRRSKPLLLNCVVWANSARKAPGIQDEAGPTTHATHSCLQGGWPGEGNIGEDPVAHDPLFVDAASGDLHLSASSPCVDSGDPDCTLTEDIEGNPRPAGSGFDMGAYEYRP